MRTLVTGATGYIGNVVAEKLRAAGHAVAGLARSDAAADALRAGGIEPVRGDLDSPETLARAAGGVDAVVHAAFKLEGYDLTKTFATERAAVRAFVDGMAGTGKPLVFTSGTGVLGDTGDRVFDETTPVPLNPFAARVGTENEVLAAAARNVRGIVLRPPSVYGRSHGKAVLTMLRAAADQLGAVPYAEGAGDRLWSYVHVDDLADLYVLAVERAAAGSLFHTAGEKGLRTKAIAEAVSRTIGLGGKTAELPIGELRKVLPLADYWSMNSQSSGEKARDVLGWRPTHLSMLSELSFPDAGGARVPAAPGGTSNE